MNKVTPLRFIDVFAGCGGLSLGLIAAGWQGVIAVEKSPMAFDTLSHNLIDGDKKGFKWPSWLPKKSMTCESLLAGYSDKLAGLKGKVDLIVGGPPCQGFSTAGKRDPADPRNKMTEQYLALVDLVLPKFIVIENVAGFDMQFENEEGLDLLMSGAKKRSYAEYIASRLSVNYHVYAGLVDCSYFGVPQSRQRFLMLCERKEISAKTVNLFQRLVSHRSAFLKKRNLPLERATSAREAISDLETKERLRIPCTDSAVAGFKEALYEQPEKLSEYQKLMRKGAQGRAPNSRRLANHRQSTIEYFRLVQSTCRPGRSLSTEERKIVGTRKHSTTVLNANLPSPTITTLPDDIIHYDEPRILTVRENARLQSFPDWFAFQAKYTTGGKARKFECPRYTQVGNAVPPLLSEAIGEVIKQRLKTVKRQKAKATC